MSVQRMGHKPVNTFIKFVDAGESPSGKTKIWNVVNVIRGEYNPDHIGVVKWSGAWRKYVFECGPSYYDWECLRLIADFIEVKTKEHRKK